MPVTRAINPNARRYWDEREMKDELRMIVKFIIPFDEWTTYLHTEKEIENLQSVGNKKTAFRQFFCGRGGARTPDLMCVIHAL